MTLSFIVIIFNPVLGHILYSNYNFFKQEYSISAFTLVAFSAEYFLAVDVTWLTNDQRLAESLGTTH